MDILLPLHLEQTQVLALLSYPIKAIYVYTYSRNTLEESGSLALEACLGQVLGLFLYKSISSSEALKG